MDSFDKGMLVVHTADRCIAWPEMRLMHMAKRLLEWWYLRQFR